MNEEPSSYLFFNTKAPEKLLSNFKYFLKIIFLWLNNQQSVKGKTFYTYAIVNKSHEKTKTNNMIYSKPICSH